MCVVCMYVHVCLHVCTCVSVCMHACVVHVCVCVCSCVYVFALGAGACLGPRSIHAFTPICQNLGGNWEYVQD